MCKTAFFTGTLRTASVSNEARTPTFKRAREFRAGRACALEALGRLGQASAEIPRAEDGRPLWPDGFVGSISHTDNRAVAIVARSGDVLGVGVDVERYGRLDESLHSSILRSEEVRWIQSLPEQRMDWPTLFFSMKESIFKCLYPITRQWIDFLDVQIIPQRERKTGRVEFPGGNVVLPEDAQLRLRYFEGTDTCLTVCALTSHAWAAQDFIFDVINPVAFAEFEIGL